MTKLEKATMAVSEYVMALELTETEHLIYESDWDLFLSECESVVKYAKQFLAVEERMRRLEKEREEMIEWGF